MNGKPDEEIIKMGKQLVGALTGMVASLLFLAGCSLDAGTDADSMDLRTIDRATTPNDALACPPNACKAKADFDSPVFAIAQKTLMDQIKRVIARQPRTELIASDSSLDQLVFVQRSKILGFPDTVWIQGHVFQKRSSVIIYSRSNYGHSDFGVNRDRVSMWIDEIQRSIASAPAVP